jgi:hypothetical protein
MCQSAGSILAPAKVGGASSSNEAEDPMTPVTARDAQTPAPDERAGAGVGVSQKPGRTLPGNPLCLTPADRGHHVSVDRGT